MKSIFRMQLLSPFSTCRERAGDGGLGGAISGAALDVGRMRVIYEEGRGLCVCEKGVS